MTAAEALERLTAALAGRYRIERELGAGGMATVYLAQDLRHQRPVAVKVLRPELAAVIGAERFLAEIQTTANLQHPHILPLFDSGCVGGSTDRRIGAAGEDASVDPSTYRSVEFLFYVMPYIEGESLRDRLTREKQLPIAEAVRIATEVAAALDYAHRRGVIHRDIKPENILLHDGSALVADFGIALAASRAGGSRMTETGMSLGTPHYMSPEQAMGEREITARSDVYALGCVLYEMLLGEPPFTGPTAQAIVAKVMTEKPAALAARRDRVPPSVEDAVLTALEKLPADRFATAAEFAAALTGGATARQATRARSGPRPGPDRWRRLSGVLGLLVLGLSALTAWALRRAPPVAAPTVFDAALPDSAAMIFTGPQVTTAYGTALQNLSIAPAGDVIVYAARQGDTTALWYRSLRDATAQPIPGTVGGTVPRISPDGSRVAYLLGDRVMVVPITGGEPRLLVQSRLPVSLEWVSPTELLAMHADGYRLSWLDPEVGQTRLLSIPRCVFGRWIAEDRQLLCTLNGAGVVIEPESGERWTIRATRPDGSPGSPLVGSSFRLVDGRYLLYHSVEGDLRATTYDRARHLAGRSVTLLDGIRREAFGGTQLDLATDGTLAFAPGADGDVSQFVRRRGAAVDTLPVEPARFLRYDLSRDRRWLAAVVQTMDGHELRIYDLRDGRQTVWLRAEFIRHPLWGPNGEHLITMAQDSTRSFILIGRPGSGVPPDTLLAVDAPALAPDVIDFHADDEVLVQDWASFTTRRFDPTVRPVRIDSVATDARFASLSPDGRHIAYLTDQGTSVVVTSYPVPGRRWQIATGGVEALWLSATELLYRAGVSWYLARLDPATGEPTGAAVPWGDDPRFSDTSGWSNRLSHDGGIIYLRGPAQVSTSYLRIMPGWVRSMKRAVDAANR